MAVSTKVITMRQGNKADYQPSKMLSGELAVINDAEELHFSARTGKSIRVATERDVEELNNKIASGGGGGNPGGNGGSIVVDSYLSEASTNPVQNKVVAKKFSELSGQKADKDYVVAVFEELKTLIQNGQTDSAIAVLDKAILDLSTLA